MTDSSATSPAPQPTLPAAIISDPNILPSNQSAVNQGAATSTSSISSPVLPPHAAPNDANTIAGPGPLRHPKPMTAADLHLQLEKEQEAVVNRLTRELSMIRAVQNASVVSNTSSTASASVGTGPEYVSDPQTLPGYPPVIRHHRTSSNASARSTTAVAASAPGTPAFDTRGLPVGAGSSRPPTSAAAAPALSRQGSTASRRSQGGSPAPGSLTESHLTYFQQQRMPWAALSTTSYGPGSSVAAAPGSAAGSVTATTDYQLSSPGMIPGTPRVEETAHYKAELETAKRENDALKKRIRELERMVKDRRASDASRTRSEAGDSATPSASVSVAGDSGTHTPAASATNILSAPGPGVGIAGPRERFAEREREGGAATPSIGVGVPDEEVKVGESAASAGLKPDVESHA